jgi:hypothetical protein
MRKKEFRFLPEHESASRIVIYIVKRIHAEDVTRPTHLPVPFGELQSMPHGMCGSGGELFARTEIA